MITAEPSTSRVEQYAAEAASAYFLTRADVMGAGRSVVFVEARRGAPCVSVSLTMASAPVR
jgi:hypothetical protein